MARFRTGNRSGISLLFILLIGGFIGWQSALYSVRAQLKAANEPIEQVSSDPLDLELFWDVHRLLELSYFDELALDQENQGGRAATQQDPGSQGAGQR